MSEFAKKYETSVSETTTPSDTEYHDICVCVPVTITPDVKVGTTVVSRIGTPEISDHCCGDNTKTSCSFTISQKLRVEIPIEFNATTTTGETFVNCGCEGCDDDFADDTDEDTDW